MEKGKAMEKGKKEVEAEMVFRFLSKLVLVAMVPVVWCSLSDPPVLVWRFSILLCCWSLIWSRLLDVTVSAVIMFLVIFSGFMAALYLDAVLDHEIGVLIAHLNSHLAVGMLGYAFAKHCQHNGLEVTPATATPPKEPSKKQANRPDPYIQILGWCYIGLITVVGAASMAWAVCNRASFATESLVLLAFGPMSIVLIFWAIYLGIVLVKGVQFIGEGRLALLGGHGLFVEILMVLAYLVMGNVGFMIVTWIGILAWTGSFGYCLCVYNSFKHEEPGARAAAKQD